jgi:hypothetical protein
VPPLPPPPPPPLKPPSSPPPTARTHAGVTDQERQLPAAALQQRLSLAREGAAKWKARCRQLAEQLGKLNAHLQQVRLAAAAEDAAKALMGQQEQVGVGVGVGR